MVFDLNGNGRPKPTVIDVAARKTENTKYKFAAEKNYAAHEKMKK